MNVLLIFNPIAGRGRARREAERLAGRLRSDGVGVRCLESGPQAPSEGLDAEPADALIVLGGDGTVHALAPLAQRLDTPLYQFPLGTENLFAREFGMNRRYATLRAALDGGRVERIDVAHCNGRTFLLMISVGPDANIIHRLAAVRRGSINHLSYLPHIAAELLRPGLTPIRVSVDGHPVVGDRTGLVVIANSRHYAVRLDPAPKASMRDGMLDVVFFPVSGSLSLVKWMALSRMRLQGRAGGLVSARGREIVVEGQAPLVFQFDGEAGAPSNGAHDPRALRISVEPAALPVLVP